MVGLPRISIVTPSFNQGRYLERTILSVLDQRYPKLEYIVIDGGSTDESVDIIRKYEPHLAYWVSEPDRGQSHAINKGFARATGDILAWLNSDDYYLPEALPKVAAAALTHPEAAVFVGAGQVLDPASKMWPKAPPTRITLETLYNWLDGSDFMQPSCFFRGFVWDRVGPLDEGLHIAFDVDLWLRMARDGCAFMTLTDVLSTAEAHPEAKTMAYRYLMQVDFAIVAMRHGGEVVARKHLEDMAQRLSWCEPNVEKMLSHPVWKLLEPLVTRFIRPAVRRRDTRPRWMRG